MTWFRVDDKLHDHRKARAAGKAAMGVWVLAGSWASDNVTDGFVPESVLPRWGTKADAGRLVKVGFWVVAEQDGEPGWRFHEWSLQNPDASSVRAKKAAESEGGQRGNHKRWHLARKVVDPDCPFCQVPDQVPDRVTVGGAESPPNPPSRPVPSRPESVVTSVGQACSLTRVDDEGLTRIEQMTKGDRAHAEATVELVLSKTTSAIKNPTAYVLAAIRVEPELYRYRRGNPKKGQECPDHPGEWADACRAHIADRKASS